MCWLNQEISSISTQLGESISARIRDMHFPPLYHLKQQREQASVPDISSEVQRQLGRPELNARIRPGARVCVAVGSRGISSLQEIVVAVIQELKRWGTHPFIVPAMGSHGGASSRGQLEVLAQLGISEATCEVPIVASMNTIQIGTTLDSVPIHFSADALAADAIVPIARIKPHTSFRGPIESGLIKMLAIGLGKARGAETLHAQGMHRFSRLLPAVGSVVLAKQPIAFGIGIVENCNKEPFIIEAIPRERIEEREKELLSTARTLSYVIPFSRCDVLVLKELGKDISGSGMDPNVTGRFTRGSAFSSRPQIQVIATLGLSHATKGNAVGLGLVDVTTKRTVQDMDFAATYTNAITAGNAASAMLPIIMENERSCMATAIVLSKCPKIDDLRMIIASNTLAISDLWVTSPLAEEAAEMDGILIDPTPTAIRFSVEGELTFPVLATGHGGFSISSEFE
jgi:hypothetical protein